ncbi:MAG: hypothetical protein QGH74_07290, partial [Candidatus Brocadiia bacterium]|nr:hypothetical protein [Candidatus Brocadiia bacterium]
YWTASTSIGILESWRIRRSMEGMELKPPDDETKGKKPRKAARVPEKKGFFGKLADAVDKQQSRSRQLSAGKKKRDR